MGVQRSSLFDDGEIEEDMEILNKIMAQNSLKRQRNLIHGSTNSEHSVVVGNEGELPRTQSCRDFTKDSSRKIERKPRLPSDLNTTYNFPQDIINVSKKIKGLDLLLQPHRSLKFKFGASVELEQKTNQSSSKLGKTFSLLRSKSTVSKEPVFVKTKCLVILFDDLLCICSEKQLEVQLKLEEAWMETNKYTHEKNDDEMYPFTIQTPEKSYQCSLDQESKLIALRKIWDLTVNSRLEDEGLLLGETRRYLAYEYQDGSNYEGEWKQALFNGKGKLRKANGEYYDGYFTNGKYNGCGTLILANTERYDGYWKFGKKHGNGTLYYTSKNPTAVKFVGSWRADQQHGEGQLYLKSGTIVKGNWKFGLPISPTILFMDDKKTRYIGDLGDLFIREGFGVCIFSSEERYYGKWVNGYRQGKGFYITAKGTEYHGM